MSDNTTIYIIKKVYASWDGCNGYDEDEYWTNWIFFLLEKAEEKCAELNREYGHYGYGSSLKYKVVKSCVIK